MLPVTSLGASADFGVRGRALSLSLSVASLTNKLESVVVMDRRPPTIRSVTAHVYARDRKRSRDKQDTEMRPSVNPLSNIGSGVCLSWVVAAIPLRRQQRYHPLTLARVTRPIDRGRVAGGGGDGSSFFLCVVPKRGALGPSTKTALVRITTLHNQVD